jgi:2-phospho-L-lactate/phosphoenolpyruvate guanylyltransferase
MNVAALLPVKGFRNAKQRLSPHLGGAARELLAETMFRDVLRQVRIARGLVGTFVVTGDEKVAAIASAAGAEVIREAEENGETTAVDFGRRELTSTGCQAVLIIPSDLPLVRAADIEQLLSQILEGATAPFALLVPSHDRLGTNALLLAPPDLIQLRFGYDSFNFHVSQVIAQGLPVRVLENEHFALDIDEPKDLDRLLSCGIETSESVGVARALLTEKDAKVMRRSGGV